MKRAPIDRKSREKALEWLRTGHASLPEIATMLGISTQAVWNWCRQHKIDWRKARETRLARDWRKRGE